MSTAESQPSYPTPVRATSTDADTNFPPPPQNKETAPFSVLASLFDRLQRERKLEKRHRLLNSWFNVYLRVVSCRGLKLINPAALAKRERIRSIPRPEAHLAICESNTTPHISPIEIFPPERQRTLRVWSQRKEPGQSVHQTHPTGIEGPRCSTPTSMETSHRERSAKTTFEVF
jgi:hypothetical protein